MLIITYTLEGEHSTANGAVSITLHHKILSFYNIYLYRDNSLWRINESNWPIPGKVS